MYIAVVNGAAHGFGLMMVKKLLESGYRVYALSNDLERVEKLSKELSDAIWATSDLSSETGIEQTVSKIIENEKYLNVLINNAEETHQSRTLKMDGSKWERDITTNIISTMYMTRSLFPVLKNGRNASVVNVPTMPLDSEIGMVSFEVCDAAIAAMTNSMATDLSVCDIRVNSVSRAVLKDCYYDIIDNKKFSVHYRDNMGIELCLRPMQDGGMAELIKFLTSDDAKRITGDNYHVQVYK